MARGLSQMLDRQHTGANAKVYRQLDVAIEKLVLEVQISPC
ncbi:MAG: hypothetical protein OXF73_05025 [Gammaproteobacteria bacterium]|nr:hypothetical protein [Gammaproteobacteria bacterium]